MDPFTFVDQNQAMSSGPSLTVTPLTPSIGARVDGLDSSEPLTSTVFGEIHAALLDHLVIVLGGQDLTPDQQIAFTDRFGAVEPHPLNTRPGLDPEARCIVLENKPDGRGARNDYWHSDITCAERPPALSLLHAVTVPDGRGDTSFCNMYRAWEMLSPGMQAMVRPLTATHTGEAIRERNRRARTDSSPDIEVPPPVTHPVLRRHDETGRDALFTNTHFTTNFTNMTRDESRPLLELFEQVATRPDNVYRHRWTSGDLVIWDNRCVMHYADYDYEPHERRRMHRTTAAGAIPDTAPG